MSTILAIYLELYSKLSVIIELSDISEPAPGIIKTTPIPNISWGILFPVKKSQTSPLSTAPSEIALAESITLAPPTAKIKVIFSSLQILIPS